MGFAVLETVATFNSRSDAVTHGFDGAWSYQGKNRTWCGESPTGNASLTRHGHSTVLSVTCKRCLSARGDVVTVMVLEPCCGMTEPGYDPGPCPAYNRTPGAWPPRCGHPDPRVPTFTEHTDLESVRAEFTKTRGWGSTDGYVFNGVMPPDGERFRIMPVGGSLTSVDGYRHMPPWPIAFPTVEVAQAYAADWREYTDGNRYRYSSLVNVVGDQDLTVRWSSYGLDGVDLAPYDYA